MFGFNELESEFFFFFLIFEGATPMDQTTIPEGSEQIFVMSQNVSNTEKEDLAWASYILLRNTNAISVVNILYIIHYFDE